MERRKAEGRQKGSGEDAWKRERDKRNKKRWNGSERQGKRKDRDTKLGRECMVGAEEGMWAEGKDEK